MPRLMSFAMTIEQVKNRTKDLTRRNGWWFLKVGDVLMGVEKSMGLKKGEKVKELGLIEVISAYPEPLQDISPADVIREGFPHFTPEQFIEMLVSQYKCDPAELINRIEFRYL